MPHFNYILTITIIYDYDYKLRRQVEKSFVSKWFYFTHRGNCHKIGQIPQVMDKMLLSLLPACLVLCLSEEAFMICVHLQLLSHTHCLPPSPCKSEQRKDL